MAMPAWNRFRLVRARAPAERLTTAVPPDISTPRPGITKSAPASLSARACAPVW